MSSERVSLDDKFVEVTYGDISSYGGDQGWLRQKYARHSGCGIIAATNAYLYIQGKRKVTREEYTEATDLIRKGTIIVPFLGMNGIMVSLSLKKIFRKKGMKNYSFCSFMPINFYKRIKERLALGFPVILAIGRNFPLLGGRKKLKLYVRNSGKYEGVIDVNAHFVTITAIDDEWLTISSWGRKYYINRKELTKYAWLRSSWLFTNIVLIK